MNQDCEPQYYMTFLGNVWQKAFKQEQWLLERGQIIICRIKDLFTKQLHKSIAPCIRNNHWDNATLKPK